MTFQQIQKYERGDNRISAGRLYEFSRALEEPVAYFFAGLPGQECRATRAAEPLSLSSRPMSRETLEIVRLFFEIQDPRMRKQVKSLLQSLLTYTKG
jgi:transcriptional regulator with XRE-family HTH domain